MTNNTQAPLGEMEDFDPNSLLADEATRRIETAVTTVQGYEHVALRNALGRVLAEDIRSQINVPPYANSAMDGYALCGDDLSKTGEIRLAVIGTAFAGHPHNGTAQRGTCVRIMTGAPMPRGTDTIVMQEHVVREENHIVVGAGHKSGQHVRQAGEDIAAGSIILNRGKRLRPADIGLLASLGIAEAKIHRRLRVAFFSTGDELCSLGKPLREGQIYDSNRYTLHGMLTQLGAEIIDMGIVPDHRVAVSDAFLEAAACADVLITTGGVSVGEADYVKETLAELGQVNFWKIAMKPGKPLAFGTVKQTVFFGLPGNPVSAMVTFHQYVRPALLRMMGQTENAPTTVRLRLASRIRKSPGRMEFQRGIMQRDAQGETVVTTTGAQGSHVLSSMSQANCFIVLPLECGNLEPGVTVTVQPFGDDM